MSEWIVKQNTDGQLEVVGLLVRCKDCKNSDPWYADERRCFLWHEDGVAVLDDGFCNYAERKEE